MGPQPKIFETLRQKIEEYHDSMRWDPAKGQHRDPFINWYTQSVANKYGDLQFRVLLILTNARFDQGTRAERALENTQRLLAAGTLSVYPVELSDVPAINTRQRMKAERWRELLWRSLPGLRQLSNQIAGCDHWKASDLLQAITSARIPYFGPKTARLAVRWISELIPDINVDMGDSEIPVDSLVYRVAARLGLLDPVRERYWGPGSPGHERIQAAARQLFPHNPSLMDEPVWMMGRQPRNGGFCSPTDPTCDRGCLFASFCPRLWQQRDPGSVGYSAPRPKPTSKGPVVSCTGSVSRPHPPATLTAAIPVVPGRAIPGLLVIVSCVKNKIWDVDPSAPRRSPANTAYFGSYFSKNRAYAQAFGEAWCVLSAKFGFVLPDDEIENYDVTFKNRSPDLITVCRLREQIVAKKLDRFAVIQVLGGSKYVDRVVAAFEGTELKIQAPLAGLRIGEAMHAVQVAILSRSGF
jgi:hypothetical protein